VNRGVFVETVRDIYDYVLSFLKPENWTGKLAIDQQRYIITACNVDGVAVKKEVVSASVGSAPE
jgi:hypothetical protein